MSWKPSSDWCRHQFACESRGQLLSPKESRAIADSPEAPKGMCRTRSSPKMNRRSLTQGGLLVLLPIFPIGAGAAVHSPIKPLYVVKGVVSSDKRFEQRLSKNLVFKIEPGRGYYEVWVGSDSAHGQNYCLPVTGPAHGPHPLFIETNAEWLSDDYARVHNLFGRSRFFSCVRDSRSFNKADWAMRRGIWAPPDGEPPDTEQKARAILDRLQKKDYVGHLKITHFTAEPNDKGEQIIDEMEFELRLYPPGDYRSFVE